MEKQLLCDIYRSSRIEGLYVYVKRGAGLDHLPEDIVKRLGRATRVMELILTAEKKLARANAVRVMERIETDGFYIQMPPGEDVRREM